MDESLRVVLALGWLAIPAIQYFATVERTRRQLGETTEPSSIMLLDLTSSYLILIVVTAAFALKTFFEHRASLVPESGIGPVAGEVL
jgi:hypothetical protein